VVKFQQTKAVHGVKIASKNTTEINLISVPNATATLLISATHGVNLVLIKKKNLEVRLFDS